MPVDIALFGFGLIIGAIATMGGVGGKQGSPELGTLVFDAPRVKGERKQQWVTVEGTKREAEAKFVRAMWRRERAQVRHRSGDSRLELWLDRIKGRPRSRRRSEPGLALRPESASHWPLASAR